MAKSTIHIRLSQGMKPIEGKERQLGKLVLSESTADTCTAPQGPAQKPSRVQKEEDALVAELDQGPIQA